MGVFEIRLCACVGQGRRNHARGRLRFLEKPLCGVAESLCDHFALFGVECSSANQTTREPALAVSDDGCKLVAVSKLRDGPK
jgi:hypothetical protein